MLYLFHLDVEKINRNVAHVVRSGLRWRRSCGHRWFPRARGKLGGRGWSPRSGVVPSRRASKRVSSTVGQWPGDVGVRPDANSSFRNSVEYWWCI
jgi:hypothetical protein